MSILKGNMCALSALMLMAADYPSANPKDPLSDIDLDAEYELIQQKKSNLSANQRARIVSIVERRRKHA